MQLLLVEVDFSVNETQASGVGNDNNSRNQVKDSSKDPKLKNSQKKVRFSDELEVFPESNVPESGNDENEEVELIRGKRFSKIEDEKIKEAVYKYIEVHNLGEEGLDMVLNSRSHPKVKNCWKEIGAAIPNRPHVAVYYRAQIIFRRAENPKWTEEEKALVLQHVKLHGNEWKSLAEELGRHRFHVKDTWRRIKLPKMKAGHWSQDEYQNLFDLVNTDLQVRITEEKKSKHGMLRDNICWTAISDKLSTRNGPNCCLKWYKQLTSPMVAEGIWSDSDDYRLIGALYNLDETCIENVDWDNLVEHRSGEICLKRWRQMVLHIGNHGNKPFSEQVEVLAKRYCPSLIEARETWDSKPVVP
nr:cyclin-D-binding Myb-like transcription factor 1 [Ipomoea trifida]